VKDRDLGTLVAKKEKDTDYWMKFHRYTLELDCVAPDPARNRNINFPEGKVKISGDFLFVSHETK